MIKNILLIVVTSAITLATVHPLYAEPVSLKYSIFFPESHIQCQTAMAWAEEINKQSNGSVKITVFPGGSLVSAPKTYDGVVKGEADIGMSCFAYTKDRFPVMAAADLPLGYRNGLTASKVVNDYYAAVKPQELADVKVLYLHAHGPGLLHTQKPVMTIEDFSGMKIRATGLSAKIVEALGGVAVAMSQGETYDALKTGAVDGTFGPMEVLKGWRQGEVIKSTTECTAIGYTTTMFVVMNLDKWNLLPRDTQKLFEDTSRQWIEKHGQVWDEADAAGRKYTLELGNGIIPLSRDQAALWSEKVQTVIGDYFETVQAENLPGKEYVDTLLSLAMLY